jgi:hypothetical protein
VTKSNTPLTQPKKKKKKKKKKEKKKDKEKKKMGHGSLCKMEFLGIVVACESE